MPATTIALSAGNAQVGYPSIALPVALAVLVTDALGAPVSGQAVAWKVGTGGGSLSAATSNTNASGIATIIWTLGPSTGQQIVTADVASLTGTPVVFTALSALVTPKDITDYYRIQTTAEVVNGLIADLISEAQGEIEFNCGKSLTQENALWYDNAQSLRIGEGVVNLILKYVPIDPTTVVVKDYTGAVVPATAYVVRLDLRMICGLPTAGPGAFLTGPWTTFDNGPYTIQCVAGFATSPSYATRELPAIQRAIKDYVGFLFQQRDVGASSLKAAGTTVTYAIDPITGLPDRVARAIRKLRGPVITL
jgi:hypothetical protein